MNERNKKILDYLVLATTLFAIFLPLVIFSWAVFSGSINFWYDSARDLLMAWDNLKKITLIGSPTGIPGVFYGPYWIWLLSLGLLISKNPRIIDFFVTTIPYCLIFPFFFLRFRPLFGRGILILIWLFFIYSTGDGYATWLWNPNLATLLFLIMIYLLVFADFEKRQIASYGKILLIGVFQGLILNFHMSLGIGVFFGTLIFFISDFLIKLYFSKKNRFKIIVNRIYLVCLFLSGIIITFLPFFIFELRHGFNQTQALFKALTSYGAVVNLPGLSNKEILAIFFGRFGFILKNNWLGLYLLEIISLSYFLFLIWRKKSKLLESEKKLIVFLLSASFGILFIYLTARNPVWEYHFIGTEVIFLLFMAIVIKRITLLKIILLIYVIYLVSTSALSFVKNFKVNPYTSSSLVTKEHIVDTVHIDAKRDEYTVFAYSSSIYTYDYTYLFRWRYNKDIAFDPGEINTDSSLVYLIIPKISKEQKEDFINYRTPNTKYKTIKNWQIPDGTLILKRMKDKE